MLLVFSSIKILHFIFSEINIKYYILFMNKSKENGLQYVKTYLQSVIKTALNKINYQADILLYYLFIAK